MPDPSWVSEALRRGLLSEEELAAARAELAARTQGGEAPSLSELVHEQVDASRRAALAELVRGSGERAPGPGETLPLVAAETQASVRRPVPSPRQGQTLGRYEVQEEIARGGMGVVYRARDPKLERDVAVKLLLDDSPQLRKRFQREAQAISRLEHPNVIPIHEVGESAGGQPFLVMSLLSGGTLEDRLLANGPLDPLEAAGLCQRLAEALQFSHEHLILHRDVKPSNVLLGDQGEPVLTDFGLAKFVEGEKSDATRTGVLLGTPAYMPPEQAAAKKLLDWRADVYSLGATLYALLCGRPPFESETALELLVQIASHTPSPPSAWHPGIPPELDTVCLKCLEKDPDDRYASAGELAAELGRVVKHQPILASPPSQLERARKWIRRNSKVAGVASGLVIFYATLQITLWGITFNDRRTKRLAAEALTHERADGFAALSSGLASDVRVAKAVSLVLAAQEWNSRAPNNQRALKAYFEALLELGGAAEADGQTELARTSYTRAAELGVDDDQAKRLATRIQMR